MSTIESFFNLNLDQILESIEEVGCSPTGHCLALNSLENRVYRIGLDSEELPDWMRQNQKESLDLKSNSKISSIVVKFYRPGRWTKAQIQEEHDFLFELEESEIPVLTPFRDGQGNSVHSAFVHPEDRSQAIYFTLWPTLRGRIVEEFSEDSLAIVGRLLARIHNVGSSSRADTRIHLDIENYGEPALEFLLRNDFIPKNSYSRYESIARKIFAIYQELSHSVPKIRIHGDCHKGNLLTYDNRFTFLDFDDFMTGVPIQDFWMLLPFGDVQAEYDVQIFLESYREFRDLPQTWLGLIEPLRGLRYIYYSSWIARRWEDPAFPNAFPHFGNEIYWEKEVRDLEQLYYNFMEDV